MWSVLLPTGLLLLPKPWCRVIPGISLATFGTCYITFGICYNNLLLGLCFSRIPHLHERTPPPKKKKQHSTETDELLAWGLGAQETFRVWGRGPGLSPAVYTSKGSLSSPWALECRACPLGSLSPEKEQRQRVIFHLQSL